MPHHTKGVYDGFDAPAELRKHYRRCRTLKDFIPSARFIAKADPTCPVCNRKCSDHGDAPEGYRSWRGIYSPKHRAFRVMHYVCAWTNLLKVISNMGRAS